MLLITSKNKIFIRILRL